MTSPPMSVPKARRPGALPVPVLDVAPVLLLGAIGAGSLLLLPPPLASTRFLLTVLVVVSVAVLLLRRRHPVMAFTVVAACLLTQWAVGIPVGPVDFVILVALYAVAARGSSRWALAALMVGLVGAVMSWLGPLGADTRRPLTGLIAPAVVVLAVYALGRNAHVRAAYLLTLEERAERLEREQQATARAAIAEERARIAREMHDVVAHRVGVMVAQADGAAYAFAGQPQQSRAALDVIADTGRAALSELRRLLDVLRADDDAPTVPQPGLSDIDDLIDQVRQAGLPVRYTVCGHLATDGQVGLAAYRIVQESLTNALKHGGSHPAAKVSVCCTGNDVEIEVTSGMSDSGSIDRRPQAHPGWPGHGLIGMRERAASLRGTFSAGPDPAGGWRVRARLPLAPTPRSTQRS